MFVEPVLSWMQSLLGLSQARMHISKYDGVENSVCVWPKFSNFCKKMIPLAI